MKEFVLEYNNLVNDYEYYVLTDLGFNILEISDSFAIELTSVKGLPINSLIQFDSDRLININYIKEKGIKPFSGYYKNQETIFLEGIALRNSEQFVFAANSIDQPKKTNQPNISESHLFKSFLDNIDAFVFYKDLEGRFIKVNKNLSETLGLTSPDDAIGKTEADFFSEELVKKADKDEKFIIQTGKSIQNEIEKVVLSDGKVNWVITNKFPVIGNDNKIIGVIGIAQDITDEKKRDESHKYEQYLFNTLMQNITDSIYFKDKNSKFIKVSNSLLFGHGLKKHEEIVGLSDFDFFTEEHAIQAYNDEQYIIKCGQPISNYIEKETFEDGSETWISTSKMPLYDNDEIVGTFGISRDITSIKIQERTQAVLYKLSEAANSIDNLEEVFEQIYLIISELLPTKNFFIGQYSSSKNLISFPYWKDEYESCPKPHLLQNSIIKKIINSGQSLLLTEKELQQTIEEYKIEYKYKNPVFLLGIPLKIHGKVLGLIAIHSYDITKVINEYHQKILTFVSTQVAAVIERVRAKEKLIAETKEREELSESLKKSNEIINNSQAVVFRWINDSDWSVEYVSENVEWIFGYSAKEFLEGSIQYTEIIHKDDLNQVTEELTNCLFDKSINYFTHRNYRIIKKSGELLWVENRTFIIRNSNGEITHYEGILIDVTERKINEEKAQFRSDFEKRIAQISSYFVEQELSNINDALSFASKHVASFLEADRSYVALSGNEPKKFHISFEYCKEGINALQIDDNCNYNFDNKRIKNLNEGMVNFIPRYGDFLDSELDEDLIQFDNIKSFIAVPIYVDKYLFGFLGYDFIENETNLQFEDLHILELYSEIISNVYKNYINEIEGKNLRIRMEKMTQAVEQSANSIVITDIDGDIEYVNPKFEDVTGYSFEEVKGKNPRILKSGVTSLEDYKDMWKTLIKGNSWKGEFKNKKKNGDFYWERVTISPIKNIDGVITNFIAVKEDITERILVENQLALSQKMESIGQLAAGIAHEINTPMQYVGDNANFLNDAYDAMFKVFYDFNAFLEDGNSYSDLEIRDFYQNKKEEMDLEFIFEEVPEALKQTHDGISRVTRIIKAMKNFAHPGTKEKSPHDINSGIENTATISRNEWKYVSELKLDLDENLGEVYCLLDELNQVFLNMIVNGAHSIEEKMKISGNSDLGEIKISTKKINNNAVIKISDSGKGIKKDNLRRIFDPFFTTKEVGKGTGQGLAIAHDIIVNKHNGTIEVESEEGNGATFILSIPIKCNEKGEQ